MQALNRREATAFYRSLASLTEGFHLQLDQFSSIVSFMLAICFREEGGATLDTYEEEVRGQGRGMNREIHRLFNTLQVGTVNRVLLGTRLGSAVGNKIAAFYCFMFPEAKKQQDLIKFTPDFSWRVLE